MLESYGWDHNGEAIVSEQTMSPTGLSFCHSVGSRALSFSDPYFHFTCRSVRHSFCHSVCPQLRSWISRKRGQIVGWFQRTANRNLPIWAIDCAWSRWRHVTGWRHNGYITLYFFKMLLLRQFSSELDDTWTQCSHIWCIYMVLTDSRSGSYDVTDDVITYNHCRNVGAKYLGNEAR